MTFDWKKLFIVAYSKAQESTNPSTQNGAVLVNESGDIVMVAANTFPEGIKEIPERRVKPLRYVFSVHAERNAIYQAAKVGVKTNGLTMVCCWGACTDCAQAIIQSGIKRLVVHKQALDRSGSWQENIRLAFDMLREAGVEIVVYDGKIGIGKILRDRAHWEP